MVYLLIAIALTALITILFIRETCQSALLDRRIGTYHLFSNKDSFFLGGDVPVEHWVRLAAHIVGSRLFYFRGVPHFRVMTEAVQRALSEPILEMGDAPSDDYAEEDGVLTYAGVGMKGFIGGPDDRPERYRHEAEGIIRWVLEDDRTAAEARAKLPKIIEQECNPDSVDLGDVNKRIRRHFN